VDFEGFRNLVLTTYNFVREVFMKGLKYSSEVLSNQFFGFSGVSFTAGLNY